MGGLAHTFFNRFFQEGVQMSKRKIDTVIFDLDGTLLYTLEDLTDSVNHIMRQFGYKERTLEEIRSFVGNGIGNLIKKTLPQNITKEQSEIVLKKFSEYYTLNCQNKTRPYDGIMELLDTLKKEGYKLAIVSNKNHKAAKELSKIYFKNYIDETIGDGEGYGRKPEPEGVFKAIEVLGSTVESSVYVGDSEVDIETGKNASIKTIIVTWGFRKKEYLISVGGEFFAETTEELLKIIHGEE